MITKMSKTVIGCWDCDYCGSDRISGDVKICPHCGKPRGKDITFYMAGPKKYADPDAVSKNPDWLCPYCNTLNPDSSGFCSACGASREESEDNYFQLKEKEREKKRKLEESLRSQEVPAKRRKRRRAGNRIRLLFFAIILFLIYTNIPKDKTIRVDSKELERSISIERYQETKESGWDLPDEARDVTSRDEVCELLTACAFGLEAGASCRLHGHRVDTTPAIPLTGNT